MVSPACAMRCSIVTFFFLFWDSNSLSDAAFLRVRHQRRRALLRLGVAGKKRIGDDIHQGRDHDSDQARDKSGIVLHRRAPPVTALQKRRDATRRAAPTAYCAPAISEASSAAAKRSSSP
jgi:hypothetical protein